MKNEQENKFLKCLKNIIEEHMPAFDLQEQGALWDVLEKMYDNNEFSKRDILTMAYCFGATVEETNELLSIGGYSPLYVKRWDDAIWWYAIKHRMDIASIEEHIY